LKNYINENNKEYSYEDDVTQEYLDEKINELGLSPISDKDLIILRQPNLEDVRISKKDELTNAFILESLKNIEINNIFYNGGFDSAIKLDAEKRLKESTGLTEVIFYGIDNNPNKISIEDATTVIKTIANKFQDDLAKYQGLKVQLSSAKDIDTIEALGW